MVSIRLIDTGYVDTEYSSSESPFPIYEFATKEQKELGEYCVTGYDNPLTLKVTALNLGQKSNNKVTPSLFKIKSKYINTSVAPFKLSITAFIKRPTDLSSYDYLILGGVSKGHKDLYIIDEYGGSADENYTLYHLINRFGKTETGMAEGNKHLNVIIDAISYNESVNKLNVNLELTVFPYIS